MKGRKFVGVTGSSGSGKSTTAKAIADAYEAQGVVCQVISLDDFYRDGLPSTTNWDHPDAFDHKRFAAFLAELLTQDVVEYPSYDFATSSRKTDCNHTKPGVKLFIFEGIFAHHPLVKALYDVTIFVDTHPDLCLDRRIARDIAERGGNEEKVREDWDGFVYPAYQDHILPSRDESDIVVSNNVSSRKLELDVSGLLFSVKSRLSGAATGRVSCSLFPRTTIAQNEFAFVGLDAGQMLAEAPAAKR